MSVDLWVNERCIIIVIVSDCARVLADGGRDSRQDDAHARPPRVRDGLRGLAGQAGRRRGQAAAAAHREVLRALHSGNTHIMMTLGQFGVGISQQTMVPVQNVNTC